MDDPREERPSRLRCKGTTATGLPCQQFLNLNVEGLCLLHDPARAAEAQAARQRGGETARARRVERAARTVRVDDPPPPLEMTLEGAARYQAWHIQQLAALEFTDDTSGKLTYALTLLVRLLEKADLEEQLKAARAELAQLRTPGGRRAAL